MTRYIDADALYASIAKDTYLLTDESNSRDYGMHLIGIKKKIDEAPTADVVEVVRCKDCKKASTTEYLYCTNDGIAECQSVYCVHYKIYMELNHYCSHGERME